MQARFHARPCNLWVMAAGNSTFCTACSRYSIGTTSNAMPPMHASRCNGSGCDFGNGLVSPTNPLTYDGRLLQQSGNWDECGASYTGGAVPVSGAVETTAPTSPATVCRSSSASSSSTSTATLEAESVCPLSTASSNGILATIPGNAGTRHAIRGSQRPSSHQHKRVGTSGPRPACPAPPTWPVAPHSPRASHVVSDACSTRPRGAPRRNTRSSGPGRG